MVERGRAMRNSDSMPTRRGRRRVVGGDELEREELVLVLVFVFVFVCEEEGEAVEVEIVVAP